jgi:AraC-like DNA-binding protein
VRTRFATRERAAVSQFINDTYVRHRLRFCDGRRDFWFSVVMASIDSIGCDRVRSSAHVRADLDPLDFLLAVQPLRGRVLVHHGNEEARALPGDSVLYPLGVPVTVEWDDIDVVALRLSMAQLSDVASELTGINPADLRFESMVPVSEAMKRHWHAVVGFIDRELRAHDSALTNPLVAEQMLRMATAAALSVFPNSTMTAGYLPGAGGMAPAALRRAVAFIDNNVHRPITLADIAEAARVGPRALQKGFAHHYDVSPVGYLRRARLERAHRELQAADPGKGATVAEIAARWGFTKPGRFAAEYRESYGQLPSHTLRT